MKAELQRWNIKSRVTNRKSVRLRPVELLIHKLAMKSLQTIEKQLADEKLANERLNAEVNTLRQETERVSEETVDLQARSMRDNLLFFNFQECDSFDERCNENCTEKIKAFCADTLKIEDSQELKIDQAHHVGTYEQNKTRPIVVKFNYFLDKVRVKQAAYIVLKGSAYRVADQFRRNIKEHRQVLYPIMVKARDSGKQVKMVHDKLYINGRVVTAKDVIAHGDAVL